MRRIVCFGDSNTYGFSPVDGSRYGEDVRWPGVLNSLLGEKFEVVNEGKNARTVAFDDPYHEGTNGMGDIEACIRANEPFELLIIMLGSNDLKTYFEATPQIIADNLKKMCEFVKTKTDTKILLASPPLLGDQIEFSPLHLEFGRKQVEYSFELAPQIQRVAKEVGAEFIDLAIVAMSSDVDCLHLMPEEHEKVARAMQQKVLTIFREELAQEAQAEAAMQQEEAARRQAEVAAQQAEAARQQAEAAAQQAESMAAEPQVSVEVPSSGVGVGLAGTEDVDLESVRELHLQAEAIMRAAGESVDTLHPQADSGLSQTFNLGAGMLEGQRERMISGKLYRSDDRLKADMAAARKLTDDYNRTTLAESARRGNILASLFQHVGMNISVEPPFRCDYGYNISVGDNFHANFDCVMLDGAKIKIGNNVFLGPRVNIYTSECPIYAPIRNEGMENAKEVMIGDDVWIGGNVTINPGVHIGNNVVIGSGSVVTGDIPDGVVAVGNPCRIIRRISDSDRQYWEKKKDE